MTMYHTWNGPFPDFFHRPAFKIKIQRKKENMYMNQQDAQNSCD